MSTFHLKVIERPIYVIATAYALQVSLVLTRLPSKAEKTRMQVNRKAIDLSRLILFLSIFMLLAFAQSVDSLFY